MSTCSQGGRSNTSRDLNIKAKHTVALVGVICITVREKAERDSARRNPQGPLRRAGERTSSDDIRDQDLCNFPGLAHGGPPGIIGTAQNAVRPLVIC